MLKYPRAENAIPSGNSQLVVLFMNRFLALEFLLYGLLLAGVGWVVQRAAPDFGRVTLIAGLAGGAVCALWGGLALAGYRRRWWVVLALAAIGFTLLSQAVMAWMQPLGGEGAPPTRLVAVWITVLLVISFGMLMNLLHGQGREVETADKPAPTDAASSTAKRPG